MDENFVKMFNIFFLHTCNWANTGWFHGAIQQPSQQESIYHWGGESVLCKNIFVQTLFFLINDTVNPSLESKMFWSAICILGSPKHEYLLPTVCMFNGQLMTCCKRSYIMRLCVCLGNSEPFSLILLSMTFIFVVIPFYLSLTHLFLFRKAWLYHPYWSPSFCLKLLFSRLPFLFCILPNFTPNIDYSDTLNTKGLHQHYKQHIRLEIT